MFSLLLPIVAVCWCINALLGLRGGWIILLAVAAFIAVELAAEVLVLVLSFFRGLGLVHLLGLPLHARTALQRRRQSQTPHQWELGNAGRGMGLLALLALGLWFFGFPVGEFLVVAWAAVRQIIG